VPWAKNMHYSKEILSIYAHIVWNAGKNNEVGK